MFIDRGLTDCKGGRSGAAFGLEKESFRREMSGQGCLQLRHSHYGAVHFNMECYSAREKCWQINTDLITGLISNQPVTLFVRLPVHSLQHYRAISCSHSALVVNAAGCVFYLRFSACFSKIDWTLQNACGFRKCMHNKQSISMRSQGRYFYFLGTLPRLFSRYLTSGSNCCQIF